MAASTSGPGVSSAGEGQKPLAGMKFAIAGKTTKSKGDLTLAMSKLGSSIVSKIDGKVAAVASTKGTHILKYVVSNPNNSTYYCTVYTLFGAF